LQVAAGCTANGCTANGCRLPQVAGPTHVLYIFHEAGMRMYGAHLLRTGFKKALIMKIFEFLP